MKVLVFIISLAIAVPAFAAPVYREPNYPTVELKDKNGKVLAEVRGCKSYKEHQGYVQLFGKTAVKSIYVDSTVFRIQREVEKSDFFSTVTVEGASTTETLTCKFMLKIQ